MNGRNDGRTVRYRKHYVSAQSTLAEAYNTGQQMNIWAKLHRNEITYLVPMQFSL